MEIKSWRELSKKKSRRRKIKVKSSQLVDQSPPDELISAIEEVYLEKKDQTEEVNSPIINDLNMSKTKQYKKSKFHPTSRQQTNKKVKNGIFWLVIGFLLLASATLLFSAFRFGGAPSDRDDIELVLMGPESVAIGQESTWIISYKNTGRVDLKKINISIRYPDGLKLKSTEPAADNLLNTSWQLGELAKGEAGEIKINAQLYGEENSDKEFKVEAVYQPVNFSSDFIESFSYLVKLGRSQFTINWELPESILPEIEQDMTWRISNISGQEISAVKLRLLTSKNFTMTNPRPEIAEIVDVPEGKAYVWPVRDYLNNQEISFNFKGKFSAGAVGLEKFKLEISSGEEEAKILQEVEKNIVILGEELALQMTINNQETLNEIVPGQKLNYQVIIQNTSGQDLSDLKVILQVNPDLIDWNTLKTVVEPIVTADGQVVLDSSSFTDLQKLEKGKELKINYELNIKNNITNFSNNFRTFGQVFVGRIGEKEQTNLSFSTPVQSAQIKSPLKVFNYAWYRDDEGFPVGTGPLPPQVGEKTVFPIDLTLQTKNSYEQVELIAFLPADVTWESNQSVDKGSLNYNSATRQLIWQIDSLAETDGLVTARFYVGLLPQSSDIGKVKNLLNTQTIKVTKQGEESQITHPALNTNLTGAMYDVGQGEIRE